MPEKNQISFDQRELGRALGIFWHTNVQLFPLSDYCISQSIVRFGQPIIRMGQYSELVNQSSEWVNQSSESVNQSSDWVNQLFD